MKYFRVHFNVTAEGENLMDVQKFYKRTSQLWETPFYKLSKEGLEYEFYCFSSVVVTALGYFWNLPRMIFWYIWKSLPMYVHTQDLNKLERNKDRYTFNKRCWIYPFPERTSRKYCIQSQLTLPGDHCLIGITLGGEDNGITFTIAPFRLFFLSIGVTHVLSKPLLKWIRTFANKNHQYSYHDSLTTEISWHDNTLWVSILSIKDGDDPGFSWNFNPVEFLLGKIIYNSETVQDVSVNLEFPGDDDFYPCQIKLTRDTWRYSRLWFPDQIVERLHMDCERGIPHYSKWGNDGMYGLCCPCKTELGSAITLIQQQISEYRGEDNFFPPLKPTNRELNKGEYDGQTISG